MPDQQLHIIRDAQRRRLWLRTVQLDLLRDLADLRGDDRAAYRWTTLGIQASEQYLRLSGEIDR